MTKTAFSVSAPPAIVACPPLLPTVFHPVADEKSPLVTVLETATRVSGSSSRMMLRLLLENSKRAASVAPNTNGFSKHSSLPIADPIYPKPGRMKAGPVALQRKFV
ncbi:hypothetical protein [Rhizobium sp. P40RR-XXII]|uniref:hypothetical protein n=1 Tax=Rhizobium sp. P40RR-XXII TaxID=2726739 RepID=UPI00197F408D|nr:hypothetical protein [Rhizobium sp. P40RR-XXII]